MSSIEILSNNKTVVFSPFSASASYLPGTGQTIYQTGLQEYLELTFMKTTSSNGFIVILSVNDIGSTSVIYNVGAPHEVTAFNTPKKLIVPPNYRITISAGAGGSAYFYGTKYTNSP